jgi:hypothetical protein
METEQVLRQKQNLDNEETVRQYFCAQGWSFRKLDSPKRKDSTQASDWLFWKGEDCFLCEVKTIESVRADIPYPLSEDDYVALRACLKIDIVRPLE